MLKREAFVRTASKNNFSTPEGEQQKSPTLTKMQFLQLEKQESITFEKSDPEEDSPRDDYKVEVLRRLMKGFSLNETVTHYRNLNSAEYAINPNNFSLDRYFCKFTRIH